MKDFSRFSASCGSQMGKNVLRQDGEKRMKRQRMLFLESKGKQMDKDEAERLARAIQILRMDWIEVCGVEYSLKTGQFEVRCSWKQEKKELFPAGESWIPLLITNPRQWITILRERGGDLERL